MQSAEDNYLLIHDHKFASNSGQRSGLCTRLTTGISIVTTIYLSTSVEECLNDLITTCKHDISEEIWSKLKQHVFWSQKQNVDDIFLV